MGVINIDRATMLLARVNRNNNYNRQPVNYGGITGGAIVAFIVVLFLIMWWVLYSEAKKKSARTGQPINHMKVIGMAALCSVGVGFIVMCLNGGSNDNNNNGGNGGQGQPMTESGFQGANMPGPQVPPMSYPNPYQGPVQSAAEDPVLG